MLMLTLTVLTLAALLALALRVARTHYPRHRR